MFYEDIFKSLNKNKVKYIVVGGMAVNLYGFQRMTGDLDIIIDLSEENVLKLVAATEELKFKPKPPVKAEEFANEQKRKEWIKEKGMKVFSFWNPEKPYEQLDVFVENPIDFKELYSKRHNINLRRTKIPLASIEHLIKLKEGTGRKIDEIDVEELKKL